MTLLQGTRTRHLGQDKSLIDRRLPFRAYRSLFGSEDLHSHFRWSAVSPLIQRGQLRTLEVGGGDGRIAFEVVRSGHTGQLIISELNTTSLVEAQRTAELGGYDNVHVRQEDLRELGAGEQFDQVLAIDVLEHIHEDQEVLKLIGQVLRPAGRLVISVPTPRYPAVFGRAFHEHLGHVRDGYRLSELDQKLTAAGFLIASHRFYTGKWVSRACRVFYGMRIPYVIGVLWAPLVRPFLAGTERDVREEDAASLAVVAIKR